MQDCDLVKLPNKYQGQDLDSKSKSQGYDLAKQVYKTQGHDLGSFPKNPQIEFLRQLGKSRGQGLETEDKQSGQDQKRQPFYKPTVPDTARLEKMKQLEYTQTIPKVDNRQK
ncbi:MAG: hypothetical protein GY739_06930, partial [Mesoflavibacter sp.]|nr:hypothetical protein [Mesoflavibacter sp.]